MRQHFSIRKVVAILLVTILCQIQVVQAAPDAGSLQQQIDREREMALPSKVPHVEAPQPIKDTSGQIITVQKFTFVGNTLLTTEQLNHVVSNYLNRPLSFTELKQAAIDIATTYRKAGWIVRAYLPKQDITEGTVIIQIIEAVFGGVELEGDTLSRIKAEQLLAGVTAAQATGQLLNADSLDRAILLLDDLPGVTVVGSLQKGHGKNETDLILKGLDDSLINSKISGDNFGPYSTGTERVLGNLTINSPLGIGDQAAVNFIHSRGNDYGRLAYSLPLGNNGLRIGVSGSYLEYDLIKGDFAGIASGDSSTVGLDINYPLIRSRMKNLYLGLNIDHKAFDNKFNQQTSSRYDINNLVISIGGNLFDKITGGGANSARLTFTQGDIDLSNKDFRSGINPLNIGGYFSKLNYHLSRQQVISEAFSAYVAISGQAANNNLDSAEKFYLGGAYGVRAYPTNEGGGDDGQLLNVELRTRLPYNFNLIGFYDLGHIKINHNNPAGAGLNSYTLQGAGLSLGWQTAFGLNFKAMWAHRIGENPNPTTNGNDQDGTLRKDRFWLVASMAI